MRNDQPNIPCYEEDEIDLYELWQTLKKRKKTILTVTLAIFTAALIYVIFTTPLYQVKANLRIGYIGKNLLVDATTLAKMLQSVYHTDEKAYKTAELNSSGAYIDTIETNRKTKEFLTIKAYGLDNNKTIAKMQSLVEFVQKSYQPKIDQYILDTKNRIQKLQTEKENIQKITIPNLQTQMKLIKNIELPKIDQKISILKNQEIPKLEAKLQIIKNQKIPELKRQIDFYKKFTLPSIDEKITFYNQKLKEYNRAIKRLFEQFSKSDDTKTMIASIQMVNYQNLILNLQNRIKDLELQKAKIIEETIPQIENKIANLQQIDAKNILFAIDNIKKVQIPNLQKQKEKIVLEKIKSIKDKIITQKNRITQIDNKINVLRYNISPANIQNSHIVGGFVYSDHPAKPKTKLILLVALITGAILGVFLAFLLEWIESEKARHGTETNEKLR